MTLAPGTDAAEAERVAQLLGEFSDMARAQTYEEAVRIFTADAAASLANVVRRLDSADVAVARLEMSEPTLDDVFLRHTGEKMRVDEVKQPSRMLLGARRR